MRYFYNNRRWRNPDNAEDLAYLTQAWETMSQASIVFAGQCKWDKFVAMVRKFHCEWEQARTVFNSKKTSRSGGRLGPAKRHHGEILDHGAAAEGKGVKVPRTGAPAAAAAIDVDSLAGLSRSLARSLARVLARVLSPPSPPPPPQPLT